MDDFHPIPLIRLFGNLIVPVQVSLSDSVVQQLHEDVTRAIEQESISGLIIDLSGVDMMDSYITRAIRDLALTARFMGIETVVCGMRRTIVVTLVEMGLALTGVSMALNLERAVERLVLGARREAAPEPEDAEDSHELPA